MARIGDEYWSLEQRYEIDDCTQRKPMDLETVLRESWKIQSLNNSRAKHGKENMEKNSEGLGSAEKKRESERRHGKTSAALNMFRVKEELVKIGATVEDMAKTLDRPELDVLGMSRKLDQASKIDLEAACILARMSGHELVLEKRDLAERKASVVSRGWLLLRKAYLVAAYVWVVLRALVTGKS
jgi:hypothetical protein